MARGRKMRGLKHIVILLISYFLFQCQAKKSEPEQILSQINRTEPENQVDSLNNIRQDGLDYEDINTGLYRQLPAFITSYLNEKYPGWLLPTISKEFIEETSQSPTGPYVITADLDNNQVTDYAVLFQFKDSIYVSAFFRQNNNQMSEKVVSKHLVNSYTKNGNAFLYIERPPEGGLNKDAKNKNTKAGDGKTIVIHAENTTQTFVYNGNDFEISPN